MGIYNADSLYIPETFEELEAKLLVEYNTAFNLNLTINEFRFTNIYLLLQTMLQRDVATDQNIALLYDKLIQYLKKKQDLVVDINSSTTGGLINAINSIEGLGRDCLILTANSTEQLIDRYAPLTYFNQIEAGKVAIIVAFPNDETLTKLGEAIHKNLGAGIETVYISSSATFQRSVDYTDDAGSTYNYKLCTFAAGTGELGTTKIARLSFYYDLDNSYTGAPLSTEEIKAILNTELTTTSLARSNVFGKEVGNIANYQGIDFIRLKFEIKSADDTQVLYSNNNALPLTFALMFENGLDFTEDFPDLFKLEIVKVNKKDFDICNVPTVLNSKEADIETQAKPKKIGDIE